MRGSACRRFARPSGAKTRVSLLRHRHHEPRVPTPSASLMCLYRMSGPLGRLCDAGHAQREGSGSRASSPARLVGVSELEAGVEVFAGKPRRTPPAWDARTPEPKRLRRSRWDADTFSTHVTPPSTRGERVARAATRRLDETPAPTRFVDAASGNPETTASPSKTSGDAPANLGVAEVAELAAAEQHDRARVRVFHLPRAFTERDVREMFTPFGALEEVRLLPSESDTEIEGTRERGVSSASALVVFTFASAASAALRLDGLLIGDRHIHVSRPASARAPNPPERAPEPPPAPKVFSESSSAAADPSRSAAVCASIQAAADYAAAVNASLVRETTANTTVAVDVGANDPPPRPLAAENPARVYVGNVPFSFGERELEALFATFGPLVSCHLVLSTSGSAGDGTRAANAAARAAAARGGVGHRGYGFVEYASRADADAAVATMSGFALAGRRLRVGRAKPLADPVKSAAARVNHATTAMNAAMNAAMNGDASATREVIGGGRSALSALAERFRDASRVRRAVAVDARRG